jgi:hypothetical protein
MSAPVKLRTQPCELAQAKVRLEHARSFIAVAELVGAEEDDELATPSVSAALAVLAGIAASDAVCCRELRMRPRGQDHGRACELLETIVPDGQAMARELSRLLAIKDDAHYGLLDVSTSRARLALRQARNLVTAAETHIR